MVGPDQITVCVLPMYHIFAMNVTMSNMLWHGGKLVTVPMFEPNMFLKTLLDHQPTTLHLAPPLVGFLANHPAVTADHLASLQSVRMRFLSNFFTIYSSSDSCRSCTCWPGTHRPLPQESSSCQVGYTVGTTTILQNTEQYKVTQC